MSGRPPEIDRIAAPQHGFITVRQLRALGIDETATARLRRRGLLVLNRRGLYALHPSPWTFRQRVAAACVHPHEPCASGLTAAHLWGLWREPHLIEVTIRYPRSASIPGVSVHRSRDLESTDVTTLDHIPVTTPSRLFVDLGRVLPPTEVERLLDHAAAIGLVDRRHLEQARMDKSAQGRNGVGVLDRLLESMPTNPSAHDSGPESTLARLLVEVGLPEPRPQWPVRAAGTTYRIDLAYPEARLAIEYDGADWHSSVAQRRRDERRQARIEALGWRFLRFTRDDVTGVGRYRTAAAVRRALDAAA